MGRVQDVGFGQGLILAMGGPKAGQLLYSMGVVDDLRRRIEVVRLLLQKELEEGFGGVYIPEALAEENSGAARGVGRQWVFPAKGCFIDPRSGREMRHHVLESGLLKAVKRAVRWRVLTKRPVVIPCVIALPPICR